MSPLGLRGHKPSENMIEPTLYTRFCQNLPIKTDSTSLLVAFSGGIDSTVLLLLATQFAREHQLPIRALHVHHGLSDNADAWAIHCQNVCLQLAVPLLIERVNIERGRAESLEAHAREMRYRSLKAVMGSGEWLLTAHHQDDQLETLLLAIKRGAGVRGLAGILPCQPFATGWLLRPLLEISRAELVTALTASSYGWIEDESNVDISYDRNFLRQQLIPQLKARWPAIAQTAARSMALCAEQEALLEELANEDWLTVGEDAALNIAPLLVLSSTRRNNVLRYWIRRQGGDMPSREILGRILNELILAKADANPQVNWGRQSCRRFQQQLHLVTPNLRPCHEILPLTIGVPLTLPDKLGELIVLPSASDKEMLRQPRGDEPLSVRFQVPAGSMLKPVGRSGRRRLKKLLQEYGIPSWQRGRIPIIYYGEEVAAVQGLFICEGFLSQGEGLKSYWELEGVAPRRPELG